MAYYELLVMIKEWRNETIVFSVCNVKTEKTKTDYMDCAVGA
jgi:hypothetical protein